MAMTAKLVGTAICSVWLAMMGALVHREVLAPHLAPGASLPVAQTTTARESHLGVYYQGHRVGSVHLILEPDEWQQIPGSTIRHDGRLRLNLLGQEREIRVQGAAFSDLEHRLRHFAVAFSTGVHEARLIGTLHDDLLQVVLETQGATTTKAIPVPRGIVVTHGFSPLYAFHTFRPHQTIRTRVFNPMSLGTEELTMRVVREEPLTAGGKLHSALVVESEYQGMRTTAWVTPDGEVLKEESPLGWLMIAESAQEARAAERSRTAAPDLLSAVAIPANRTLAAPERLASVTLLMAGLPETLRPRLTHPRQERLGPDTIASLPADVPQALLGRPDVETLRVSREARPTPLADAARYLQATVWVQADHPEIRRQAQAIAGALTDPAARAQVLNRWVHQTLTKSFTLSMPSALDALHTREGDCNEHTVLFTALARSLGLPTRMQAGLAYYGGAFFYHAWPEIYADGRWVALDPTLGQAVADPTHLALVEAEGPELIELAKVVGRLQLWILDVE